MCDVGQGCWDVGRGDVGGGSGLALTVAHGLSNPLSSTVSHKREYLPNRTQRLPRHKRMTRKVEEVVGVEVEVVVVVEEVGNHCMSVLTLYWSILFFAHSLKSKQDHAS